MDMMGTTTTPKSPVPESETPIRIRPTKPIPFSNGGVRKRAVVTYKECLKNHAAALGGHALDGCGEFMPSPSSTPSDPTSLKCAACGCHRNFHRRDPDDSPVLHSHHYPLSAPTAAIEYQPHHRHHPPPPQAPGGESRSPSSASPPPISSSYMLLSLSGFKNNSNNHKNSSIGFSDPNFSNNNLSNQSRKRFRTKFSQYQKEKMHEFAEKMGWKMQKRDGEAVREFCREIGVDRGVLKVWMHNNKNTVGRRDQLAAVDGNGSIRSRHETVVGETNRGGSGHDMGNDKGGFSDQDGGRRSLSHDLHRDRGGGFESDPGGACAGNAKGSSSSS